MAAEANRFASKLRDAREAAGLSQYALAKRSGLSKQALSGLEAGIREPTWQTVQLLAVALGVSCETFVDPEMQPPEGSDAPPRSRGRPRKEGAAEKKPAGKKPAGKKGRKGQ